MATIICTYIVSLDMPWLILSCELILFNTLYLDSPCNNYHDEWWSLWVQYIDGIIHSCIVSYNLLCLDLGCQVLLLSAEYYYSAA